MKIFNKTWMFALAALMLLSGCSPKPMMVDERVSPYGVEQTIEAIRSNAIELGWAVPAVHNMNKPIEKHLGKPLHGKVRVMKLCNPHYAHAMLSNDEGRYASVFMHCSIAVYTKEDGNTYVTNLKAGRMGNLLGGVVGEVMREVDKEQQQILGFLDHPK